jgi:dTDP-4-dehydrorhamnose reductase
MRILILGANGMLGHELVRLFRDDPHVYALMRGDFSAVQKYGIFYKQRTICGVDAADQRLLERTLEKLGPDAVINCIGIVKQVSDAHDAVKSIEINALFPHRLAALCAGQKCRLIHISTDCVFSGAKGNYREEDNPDPVDLYGRSKLLGEVTGGDALTIRTSMIGRELNSQHGLLEWFLSQKGGQVKGYTKAVFSGFTTGALSVILKEIVFRYPALKGLYHVSSAPISKFDLLALIREKTGIDIEIVPDDQLKCDRSLDSSRFRAETQYSIPSWDSMIEKLAEDIKRRHNDS